MFKRTIAALTVLAALLCLTVKVDAAKSAPWLIYWYVCGTDIETARIAFQNGTDLMSDDPKALILAEPDRAPGDATRCIKEVDAAELSPDVKIFMQAGGTYIWGHEKFRDLNAKIQTNVTAYNRNADGTFSPVQGTVFSGEKVLIPQWFLKGGAKPEVNGKIGRYVYDKYHRNWHAREQLNITGARDTETDMGSQAGLVSFLQAGQRLERELYPDGNVRRMLIFVDHGVRTNYGLYGVCSDAYTQNALTLKEIQNAFAEVKGGWSNPDAKPFEVVAFDACIMSAYETAVAVEDAANYMVASQESTFGKVMFGYTGLLNDLSKNPSMSGAQLGKVICDTCWDDSKIVDKDFRYRSNAVLTMSVVDLSAQKMDALKTAYAKFGAEAVKVVQENPDDIAYTFTKFKNAANVAEKYPNLGGGSPNLVDLKNFAGNLRDNFTELNGVGSELVTAIDNAIVYQRRGSALNRGGGLSVYYPFDLLNSGQNIGSYQKHIATDKLSPESPGELYNFFYNNLQSEDFDFSALENEPIEVDEQTKTVRIEVSPEELRHVESVRFLLCLVAPAKDSDGIEKLHALFLGNDNAIKENRNTGIFESTFRGKWIALEGEPLFVQIVSDATRKNKHGKKVSGTEICLSPILLNGQQYALYFSRKYPNEKVTILGAVRDTGDKKNTDGKITLPNSEPESLNKGDVVTPIYPCVVISKDTAERGSKDVKFVNQNSVTIGSNPKIKMETLPDAAYMYMFQFVNPFSDGDMDKDVFSNEVAFFRLKDGAVTEVKHINDISDIWSFVSIDNK